MKRKLNILFVHSNIAQFRTIHEYLVKSKLANSWLVCSQQAYAANKNALPNLLPFTPHGNKLNSENGFFYLKKLEEVNRRSLGVLRTIQASPFGKGLDVIVAHGTGGAPLMLFEELDIPIVSYIEFPSFTAHGWDKRYPPPLDKIRRDRNFEMLSFYNVSKSAHVITPSEYAKKMFPIEMQSKITAQMDGFQFEPPPHPLVRDQLDGPRIGFTARDLSSAKGIEHFILVSKKLLAKRPDLKFVIIGSPKLLYSYEQYFLDRKYGSGSNVTYLDYLIRREKLDLSCYEIPGKLARKEYLEMIDSIDIFHYPVQFSSASWGLFELLARGKVVLCSNRCYVPEVIKNGENGYLVAYGDYDAWVDKTLSLLDDAASRASVAITAVESTAPYSIERVAKRYLEILSTVAEQE